MARPEDVIERKPGRVFRPRDETTQYWVRDDKIYYRDYPVRGAHIPTFRFYLGHFAKDRKHGYCTSSRLAGSTGESFRALNFCYATDGGSVWTMDGIVKGADAATFVVCDDGVRELGSGARVPSGFGKDRAHVYHYDHQGKPKWVRKADPDTFESLDNGIYGKDRQSVFCRTTRIAGARVEHWRMLGGNYSKDDRNVYYDGRCMADADIESFQVVREEPGLQLAKDRFHTYWNADAVDEDNFEKLLAEPL